jgi:hypothetical protein
MIATIGSWVYVLSVALVVAAFIELLMPRSPAAGLARAVVGLCVIALLFDIALTLAREDLAFDIELSFFGATGLQSDTHYLHTGEALAQGTLAVVQQGFPGLTGEEGTAPPASTEPAGSSGRRRIGVEEVQAIAQVKVGGSSD